MLEYYGTFFDCVEINSTYYRIMSPYIFGRMVERTPPGFVFTIKLHRSMTHDRAGMHENLSEFKASIQPLRESGKLHGLLAQFPWSFKNSKPNREHLLLLRSSFSDDDLYIEFRNASWSGHGILNFLREHHLLYCSVDEPALPGLLPSGAFLSGDKGYVRFHGRNKRSWWGGDSAQRYHYSYRKDELLPWCTKIRKMGEEAVRVYVFFNNCHAGHAARNAVLMKKLLGLSTPSLPGEQGDLFEDM